MGLWCGSHNDGGSTKQCNSVLKQRNLCITRVICKSSPMTVSNSFEIRYFYYLDKYNDKNILLILIF
jgi:hypothetical protein